LITSRIDELAERDVIVIADTDPDTLSELRKRLRPRAFMLALIGKDGGVALRKPLAAISDHLSFGVMGDVMSSSGVGCISRMWG
jgi:hypothetical protein